MIRRRPDISHHVLTKPFFVLVALVDTMRLHGIQSPAPAALMSFSGNVRPLSIVVYAAKGDMAIKVIVLSGNARRQVISGISTASKRSGAIHAFIKGTFCFAYALFVTLNARVKVDGVCRFTV